MSIDEFLALSEDAQTDMLTRREIYLRRCPTDGDTIPTLTE